MTLLSREPDLPFDFPAKDGGMGQPLILGEEAKQRGLLGIWRPFSHFEIFDWSLPLFRLFSRLIAGKIPPSIVSSQSNSRLDQVLASVCVNCPVCRHARKTQAGTAFSFVKKVEGSLCPFCRAYERVYGRKSHEPKPV